MEADVAGPRVAGNQGGVETGVKDSRCSRWPWGRVSFRVHGCQNEAAGSTLRGFSSPREPAGILRLGVEFGIGGCTEAAVFSCKSGRCRTARTATSLRRKTASAAVTARRPRSVAGTLGGMAPGDRTKAERPLCELRAGQSELRPLGASRLSGEMEK